MSIFLLPHLDTFQIAAKNLSFTQTAKDLEITQAAVSQRIAALETACGHRLFNRVKGRVKLNKHGEALLKYAIRIHKLHSEANDALQNIPQEVSIQNVETESSGQPVGREEVSDAEVR